MILPEKNNTKTATVKIIGNETYLINKKSE